MNLVYVTSRDQHRADSWAFARNAGFILRVQIYAVYVDHFTHVG